MYTIADTIYIIGKTVTNNYSERNVTYRKCVVNWKFFYGFSLLRFNMIVDKNCGHMIRVKMSNKNANFPNLECAF